MRLYLDTNILVFMLTGPLDAMRPEVLDLVTDCANTALTSGVCVHELLHLQQIGKLELRRTGRKASRAVDVLDWLDSNGIGVKYVEERHLRKFSWLPMTGEHRDPFDRLIIAQAIEDGIALVSSDRKFGEYENCGLELIFND